MPAYLVESPTVHEWTISDHPLTTVAVDLSQVRLQSWTGGGAFDIRFGAPFLLTRVAGNLVRVDAENPLTVAPLLELLGRGITRVCMTRAANLVVEFDSGDRLTAEAHREFDSWEAEFTGPFGRYGYLCGAGGGSPWG